MKKNKRQPVAPAAKTPIKSGPLLTKTSLKFIGAGVVTLIIGYTILSFADSKAQNLPGKISPFLILGGYALIGVGLFLNQTPSTTRI